jgi:hypothetical protein
MFRARIHAVLRRAVVGEGILRLGSWYNPGQTKVAVDLIRFFMSQKDRVSLENGIGVIALYNEQTRQLEQCLLGATIFQHEGEMEQ